MDEHKLIDGLLLGDNKAFRELVSLYQDKVYNTIYGFVHEEEDTMELSQDVFVEVHKSIHKFRKASSLATWIYRIAVNKALNHKRNKKGDDYFTSSIHRPDEDDPGIQAAVSREQQPQEQLENKELARQLNYAIDSLPKNQRIAFILNELEDLPYKEIAHIMDISLSSVESLIFRARKNLQQKLLKYFRQD